MPTNTTQPAWSNLPPNSRRDAAGGAPQPTPGRKPLLKRRSFFATPCVHCNDEQWIEGLVTGQPVACPACHPGSIHCYIVSPVPDNPPDAYQRAF